MTGYFGDTGSWSRHVASLLREDAGTPFRQEPCRKGNAGMARTLINSGNGTTLTLTVPIVGGGRHARHTDPDSWIVADHGRWPDVHLGAFTAAYGQTPFFLHYYPRLRHIIACAPGMAFPGLCAAIRDWVADSISLPAAIEAIRRADTAKKIILASRAKELAATTDPRFCVADLLFHLGPEAILPLAATFFNEPTAD